jgi:hypothetical protein
MNENIENEIEHNEKDDYRSREGTLIYHVDDEDERFKSEYNF